MSEANRSPGWYPDPLDSGKLKWWNGTTWTNEPSHLTPNLNSPMQPPGSSFVNSGPVSAPPFDASNSDNQMNMQNGVSFTEAIKLGFGKYATFSGRACRSEYWYFVLFNFLAVFAALIMIAFDDSGFLAGVGLIGYLGLAIPNISVLVRRLHDTDKSGWWYWIALIPFGAFALLVFLCQDGDKVVNRYGARSR